MSGGGTNNHNIRAGPFFVLLFHPLVFSFLSLVFSLVSPFRPFIPSLWFSLSSLGPSAPLVLSFLCYVHKPSFPWCLPWPLPLDLSFLLFFPFYLPILPLDLPLYLLFPPFLSILPLDLPILPSDLPFIPLGLPFFPLDLPYLPFLPLELNNEIPLETSRGTLKRAFETKRQHKRDKEATYRGL